jgi:hypothetical protein
VLLCEAATLIIETVSHPQSADFIAFLKKLEDAYPAPQRIRLILDNIPHTFPKRRGATWTRSRASFLCSTRTMLRGIRVASKQELVDRIHLYFEEINTEPVIFRWKYKMDETFIV